MTRSTDLLPSARIQGVDDIGLANINVTIRNARIPLLGIIELLVHHLQMVALDAYQLNVPEGVNNKL
jgi:hypothetical protein